MKQKLQMSRNWPPRGAQTKRGANHFVGDCPVAGDGRCDCRADFVEKLMTNANQTVVN
jgi:hypothetical protein